MNQKEAKQWCKQNPGVVIQHNGSSMNNCGMSWNGTQFRFWIHKMDKEELDVYGRGGTLTWYVVPWSPLNKRPIVGGI